MHALMLLQSAASDPLSSLVAPIAGPIGAVGILAWVVKWFMGQWQTTLAKLNDSLDANTKAMERVVATLDRLEREHSNGRVASIR